MYNHHVDQEITIMMPGIELHSKSPHPSHLVFFPSLYPTIFSPRACHFKRIQSIVIALMELMVVHEQQEKKAKWVSVNMHSREFWGHEGSGTWPWRLGVIWVTNSRSGDKSEQVGICQFSWTTARRPVAHRVVVSAVMEGEMCRSHVQTWEFLPYSLRNGDPVRFWIGEISDDILGRQC